MLPTSPSASRAVSKAFSGGSARLVVQSEKRMRLHKVVHLLGLTVPVIFGHDFLACTGMVIDVANGGWGQVVHAALLPFAKLADVSEKPSAPNTLCSRATMQRNMHSWGTNWPLSVGSPKGTICYRLGPLLSHL